MARPLRGGGRGKGRAIKEKITFFETFFFILLPFRNKSYFTLNNLSKYGHITLNFVGKYFTGLLFKKNRACFAASLTK